MEKRHNKRFSVPLNVIVECPGGRALQGQTRNVSFGGVFVDIDMANLPRHGLIQLLIPLDDGPMGVYIRMPAVITHYAKEGIGLMFCDQSNRLVDYLRAWLMTRIPAGAMLQNKPCLPRTDKGIGIANTH